jgi:hypothetical protein
MLRKQIIKLFSFVALPALGAVDKASFDFQSLHKPCRLLPQPLISSMEGCRKPGILRTKGRNIIVVSCSKGIRFDSGKRRPTLYRSWLTVTPSVE